MSETSIFPGADDESTPVVPQDDVETDGGDASDRRKLLLVGGAAGLVIVLAAAYFVLHKGSSSSPTASTAAPGVVSTGTVGSAGATPTPSAKAPRKLPKVAKQADVRDPFVALITAPVTTGNQPQSTTTVSPSPVVSPSATTTTPASSQSSAPVVVVTSPSTPPSGTSSSTPQWIRLMSVKGNVATFEVGYPNHKFKEFVVTAPKPSATTGTVFDKIFTLIGVEAPNQAAIQIGDATPINIQTGVSHAV